ncbi:MAG: pantoate--beta-alanine ligase [Bacteroidia bacterium]
MLETFTKIADLQQIIHKAKAMGKTVGFVPTMGALHAGHLSLAKQSLGENDFTVCSIFVNPTQFNDKQDYILYPRHIGVDQKMLQEVGVDYLFLPDEKEIYPDESYKTIDFDPGIVAEQLEGAHRPGHFAGVGAVVKRLFEVVNPDKAYFGQKDYQQYLIIKELAKHFFPNQYIELCPTLREPNGLAMSSRNQRLTAEEREKASIIYKMLQQSREKILAKTQSFTDIEQEAKAEIEKNRNFQVDYFDICSAKDLTKVQNHEQNEPLIICAAVKVGNVRLIDNLLI